MLLAGDAVCIKVRVSSELSQSKLLFNVLCAGLWEFRPTVLRIV